MKLAFSFKGTKVQVDVRNADGSLKARITSKFSKDQDFEAVAEDLGIDTAILRRGVDSFQLTGAAELDLSAADCFVFMRPITGGAREALRFSGPSMPEAFAQALATSETELLEPIIYWDSLESLAAVDVDGTEFTQEQILTLEGVPVPLYAWVTKSGGLRLIYTNQDPFTAEEVAAIAYLCLSRSVHGPSEIKKDTRHPAYPASDGSRCGTVIKRQQQFDPSHLRRWLRIFTVSDSEAIEWLESKGLKSGGRYDHSHCPADAGHVSHGTPVYVGEYGITCHSCEARGVSAGSSRPGFFPFTYLCGTSASSLVYRCMENATHWEHARFVLESKLQLTGRYAALIYSAGLLLHGWPRDLISRIFAVGCNFVRMHDRWCNLNGETYGKDVKPILGTLPICCVRKGAKFLKNPAAMALFDQTFDLASYGYPSIQPIYGCRIWPRSEERIDAIIQTRELADESMIKYRPVYRAPSHRLPVEQAWGLVEAVFPGVSRQLIKLLIAARGIVESDFTMTPMIFVTGPTGSGKTLSVFLAASMIGDKNTEVVWTNNSERLRQAIIEARGTFVTFNEVLKESKRQTRDVTSSMDFVLNLTPDSVSHVLYTGPVRMGALPVMVWTDTELPVRVKQDAQLARRIVCLRLNNQVDWESTLRDSGVGHPSRFRTSSELHAEACNSIVSEMIDTYFQGPSTFETIAEKLGVKRLSKSEEAEESRALLRRLYTLVCKAPGLSGPEAERWTGRGWKLIRHDIDSELRNLWVSICDDADYDFTVSRRCSEVDWQQLIETADPITFESRPWGKDRLVVRFRNGTEKVNEELKT